MSETTAIEWTDSTWTPIRARGDDGRIGWHCAHVSEGCRNCYAERINMRLGTGCEYKPAHLVHTTQQGDQRGDVEVFLDEQMLQTPLRWRKPRTVFVCSMTDLFADFVRDEWIDRIFAVMALCPRHTFQVLTKRTKRMRDYMARPGVEVRIGLEALGLCCDAYEASNGKSTIGQGVVLKATDINPGALDVWPLPNVWLGVSAEDQQTADERIPDLLATPAAVHFVSLEPLLGPIDMTSIARDDGWMIDALRGVYSCHHDEGFDHGAALEEHGDGPRIAWVIAGGESGPGARPMHPEWVRSLRDQCKAADVAFCFKQWGAWTPGENVLSQRGRIETATWFDQQWLRNTENLANEGHRDGEPDVYRVGKKAAGRLLDGRTHDEFPVSAK